MAYIIGAWIVVGIVGLWWSTAIANHPGAARTRGQYYYRKVRK